MIVEKLAYQISVNTEQFLSGKKKAEEGANDLRNNLKRSANESTGSVNSLTKSVTSFGEAGKSAFSSVQLGAAKFLGVALTLEGARRMFTSTTRDLVNLGNVSSFLGMSAKSLDGFNRAAAATGVSSASMGSMLMRIKNAQLWSRTGMGAPDEATIAMQQLQGMTGVNVLGAKDPGQGILRQAQALRKLSSDQAQVMWQRMGGQSDMFNLMYSGNLSTLQKDFEKRSNATPAAIKQAQDVTKTLEELRATADSVGQEFVRIFGKDINDALREFGDWVENNKDNILGFFRDGAKWARELADALNGTSNALHAMTQFGDFNLLTGFDHPKIDVKKSIEEAKGNLKPESKAIVDKFRQNGGTGGASGFFDSIMSFLGVGSAGAADRAPNFVSGTPSYAPSRLNGSGLMDALMMTESGGNPLAYNSKSGAAGAFQFMPATARELGLKVGGGVDERLDPEKSRAAASQYMSQLLKHYNGNVEHALRAYNWGMGNMDSYLKTGRGSKGQPMPQETIDYSGKVAVNYQKQFGMASMPSSAGGSVDNSQTSSTNVQTVNVYSNPTSADQLTQSINGQVNRGKATVAFSSGVK